MKLRISGDPKRILYPLEMQTDGRLFKEEEYDLWMLDVSKIHSVRCVEEGF
jgi:hypothetical protein